MTGSVQLDEKAWLLLQALQADGRAPLKALAGAAGLSVAATAERLKRLHDSGVIRGVHAEVDAALAGWGVRAVVGITVMQPHKAAFLKKLAARPEVLECHHVTGAEGYLMTVVTRDLGALEHFLADVSHYGETRTSVVMSTPIARRGVQRPR